MMACSKLKLLRIATNNYWGRLAYNIVISRKRQTHNNAGTNPTKSDSKEPPLVDLYGRRHNYLRISLTERCNLRCQYCMPAEGVTLSPRSELLTRAELLRLTRVFAALGIDKLRLTGGEPTVRSDLVDIVQELSSVPGVRTVGMTSNGVALTRRLPALRRAGLAALNVSLDSLRPDRFERLSRRAGAALAHVRAAIDTALHLDLAAVKINTVLMRGFNDDEVLDFVELTRHRRLDVRFIEFMPFSGNRWDDSRMVPEREVLATLSAAYPGLERSAPDAACDTAALWRAPGHVGRVGFISSMSKPFCATCSRLRLTADGNLKVCLFGAAETSLRDAMRAGADDDHLAVHVRAALRRKLPQHAESRSFEEPADDSHRRLGVAAILHPVTARAPRSALRVTALTPRSALRVTARAPRSVLRVSTRAYCTLTHLDAAGRARMVDVAGKAVTARAAEAECFLQVGARLLRLLRDARVPKGDALTVAEVAGALAAKRTADLIPLCHPLPLELARVRVTLPPEDSEDARVRVWCEARATGRTGVEMEALTGCAVAALALYDMCKAVDKHMRITDLRVVHKEGGSTPWPPPAEGGKADDLHEEAAEEKPRVRAHDTSPLPAGEAYAPTNVAHF